MLSENVELLKADYLSPNFPPPEILYRKNLGDSRYYLKPLDSKGLSYQAAIGITSAIPEIVPINDDWLHKWKAEVGEDTSSAVLFKAATFGSIGHLFIAESCKQGNFDFSIISDFVREHTPRSLEDDLRFFQFRMRKNIASIAQFFSDYDVVPYACEYPVFNHELGLAHYVDGYIELTFNRKRRRALVDWKFTAAGTFMEPYHAQSAFAKNLWNINAESKGVDKAEMCFLLAPKRYKKLNEPTYNLENCSGNIYDVNFQTYMNMWKLKKSEVLKKLSTQEVFPVGKYPIGKGVKFAPEEHYKTIQYYFL